LVQTRNNEQSDEIGSLSQFIFRNNNLTVKEKGIQRNLRNRYEVEVSCIIEKEFNINEAKIWYIKEKLQKN